MEKVRVYLETTLFNYYVDVDRDLHAATVMLFEECISGKFEPYTSLYVIDELEATPDIEKRDKMVALIERYNITILAASEEINNLAARYLAEGALPQSSLVDARHIASASVNALDRIISLNFRHIVREKTVKLTGAINTMLGYKIVEIKSPMEVIDYEKS